MPRSLSDLPSMSWTTSAATPTAWRCPMSGFSQPITEKSPSVTGTEKITTKKDHAPRCPRIHPPLLASRDSQRFRPRASLRFFGQPIQKPSLKVPSTPRAESRSAQAPPKISSPADAPTHRHRYHSMPSMPKGNSGFPFESVRPHTMGFFVMIPLRSNTRVLPPLCNSANASVRLVSSFYLFSAHFQRASQLCSLVNSNAACSSHDHQCYDVCSDRCPRCNPHRRPSLLHLPL